MSIKEKRQQRRKELYGQFVSVQRLIDYLADMESLGIDEVAAELEIAFIHNQAITDRPAYGYVDEPTISFVPYSDHDATGHLSGIFSDLIMLGDHGGTSDYHGWLRDDLFAFLQGNGIDVPTDFPAWSPQDRKPSLSIVGHDEAKAVVTVDAAPVQEIRSETFSRLMRSLINFPIKYPNYREAPPKLNVDVRHWLHEVGLVTDGPNGRQALIFGRIIAEHFKL